MIGALYFSGVGHDELPEEDKLVSDVVDFPNPFEHGLDDFEFELVVLDGGYEAAINALDLFFNILLDVG